MSIAAIARSRGITRLCHFTPARNFAQMLNSGLIESTANLNTKASTFKQNDTYRVDGGLTSICCSIEYPNTWYLDQIRAKDLNFSDWVILAIDISLLDRIDVAFFPYNASRGSGSGRKIDVVGFDEMFAPKVVGQREMNRRPGHPTWWPTDDQAEVQVPGPIPISSVQAVIYRTEQQYQVEVARHSFLRPLHPLPPGIIAPTLFEKRELSSAVRAGRRPSERPTP